MKRTTLSLLLLALVTAFAGCDREGPLERAGEKADQAGRDLQQATQPESDRR
jgi:predicted small lipoprotein YifL